MHTLLYFPNHLRIFSNWICFVNVSWGVLRGKKNPLSIYLKKSGFNICDMYEMRNIANLYFNGLWRINGYGVLAVYRTTIGVYRTGLWQNKKVNCLVSLQQCTPVCPIHLALLYLLPGSVRLYSTLLYSHCSQYLSTILCVNPSYQWDIEDRSPKSSQTVVYIFVCGC